MIEVIEEPPQDFELARFRVLGDGPLISVGTECDSTNHVRSSDDGQPCAVLKIPRERFHGDLQRSAMTDDGVFVFAMVSFDELEPLNDTARQMRGDFIALLAQGARWPPRITIL